MKSSIRNNNSDAHKFMSQHISYKQIPQIYEPSDDNDIVGTSVIINNMLYDDNDTIGTSVIINKMVAHKLSTQFNNLCM